MKESIVFYKSFYEAIKNIPQEEQLKLYNAIFDYSFTEKEPKIEDGIAKAMFILMKPNIDSANARYKASVKNGKRGGRPKKETQEKPSENLKETQRKPNQNLNDNEDDNVNVNDNVTTTVVNKGDSCVDGLSEIIDFYNNNIGLITPYGAEILEDYLQEMSSELIIYAMQISVEANKRNIKYIKAILNNWQKAGIKTLIEAKNENSKTNKISAEEEFLNE